MHVTTYKKYFYASFGVAALSLGFFVQQFFTSPTIAVYDTLSWNMTEEGVWMSEKLQVHTVFTGFSAEWVDTLSAELFYRTSSDGKTWSEWYDLAAAADVPTHFADAVASGWIVSDLHYGTGEWLQFQGSARVSADTPIQGFAVTTFTIPQHNFNSTVFAGVSTGLAGEIGIIPRERWLPRSDEVSLNTRKELWEDEYKTIDKIIVHHTAGKLKDVTGDDVITRSDYEVMVRNLYTYHAKKLGWGDVGYNYIIDPLGNIYEGRAGGEGVEGGHTLRSAACNKDRFGKVEEAKGFNSGTIGIGILGEYESDTVSIFVQQALTKLVAYQSALSGIDPEKTSVYNGEIFPNVGGHSDFDCTNCPGSRVAAFLPQLRRDAKAQAMQIASRITRSATLTSPKNITVVLEPGETKNVVITYKNNGNTNWHSFPNKGVYLGNGLARTSLSQLGAYKLAVAGGPSAGNGGNGGNGYVTTYATNALVSPGSVGTFSFAVTAPNRAQEQHTYVLASGQEGWFPGSEVTVTLVNGDAAYLAELRNHTVPEALAAEATQKTLLTFENTGDETWLREDIFLEITEGPDRSTQLADGWNSMYGWFAPTEESVAPGSVATFEVHLRAPAPGIYPLHIVLRRYTERNTSFPKLIWPKKDITGGVLDMTVKVRSGRQAGVASHTMPTATRVGWRPNVKVGLKNNGTVPWTSRAIKLVAENDEARALYDSSDWIDKNTPALMHERTVNPGEVGIFTYRLRTRDMDPGIYTLQFKLLLDGKTVYFGDDQVVAFKMRIDGADGTHGTTVRGNATVAPTPTTAPTPTPIPTTPTTKSTAYTVRSGDTLSAIAAKHLEKEQTYFDIIEANKAKYPRIASGHLQIGWMLTLPSVEPAYVIYTVKSGDSLISIDAKHMTREHTYKDIIAYNKDTYPSIVREVIQPGWKLKVDF